MDWAFQSLVLKKRKDGKTVFLKIIHLGRPY